jgi:hypothetical protein
MWAKSAAMSAFAEELRSRCPERGASRPVSRVLYGARFRARDGHSSGTAVAGRLEQPTRATIRRRIQGFLNEKSLASPLFGLAPGGACHAAHVAMRAVRSYRTVSPLPCGGLFSAKAAAIRPAGPIDIGVLSHFVNYRIGNASVVQMPYRDKFRSQNAISGLTRHTG